MYSIVQKLTSFPNSFIIRNDKEKDINKDIIEEIIADNVFLLFPFVMYSENIINNTATNTTTYILNN